MCKHTYSIAVYQCDVCQKEKREKREGTYKPPPSQKKKNLTKPCEHGARQKRECKICSPENYAKILEWARQGQKRRTERNREYRRLNPLKPPKVYKEYPPHDSCDDDVGDEMLVEI